MKKSVIIYLILGIIISFAVGIFVGKEFFSNKKNNCLCECKALPCVNEVADNSSSNTNSEIAENKEVDTNKTSENVKTVTPFSLKEEVGTATVNGYAVIKEKVECADDLCLEVAGKFNYVFFKIVDSDSTDFVKYVNSMSGNAFVQTNAIGLGRYADGIITYYNCNDDKGCSYTSLSKELSDAIINSNKDNQIKLSLTKYKNSNPSGVPSDYSHISLIELAQ